jgi:hypothetical protein
LGIAEAEVVAMTREASSRYKMVVVRVARWVDGTNSISIYLSDRPDRPHGIIVVFRKVDGRWQEDAKSKSPWIA